MHPKAAVAAFALLLLPAPGSPYSLEQILSAPYPTELVVADDATRLAWVVEDKGRRNVFTAAAPEFSMRRLTDYAADDGQLISDLALTPDGSRAVYVRGGQPNRAGEYPNPASLPDGVTATLWAVDTAGGEPWQLAEEIRGAVVSPDGAQVLFTRKKQIYAVQLASRTDPGETGNETEPEPLFKARGSNQNPRWSPDGRRVAFVSNRDDHSFIGVYDMTEQSIRWMAPDVDRDYQPAWSPDGRSIAFLRRPGARRGEQPDITSGWPFGVWVADAATGEAKEIWRSPGNDGGFAHYYPSEPLRWTAADRILFYSEHDGWLHIYSIKPDGGDLVDLTPGAGMAEDSAVSPDGRTLYFSGNFANVNGRDLWRVPVTGGTPTAVTSGPEIDTHPVAANGLLAWRSGTAKRPQAIRIAQPDGGESRHLFPQRLPRAYPEDALQVPEGVIFEAPDGLEIHGQLFVPDGIARRDRPALIFMHGGPIRQMLPGYHYRGYYAKAYAMNQYLAGRGYVVLAVNFRSGIGYGRAFRQAQNQGPRGASEYQDILAAAEYLQSRPEVDPERIGLWGGSYGGYLTALGLARDSHLFAAGVDLHGVHDWSFRATDFFPGGYWGITGEDLMESAVRYSPVADLSFWTSPILFIHGDDDRNVLFAQTTDLVQRLRERDVAVETLVFPDEVHGFLRHASWLHAYRATADFFDRRLRRGDRSAR